MATVTGYTAAATNAALALKADAATVTSQLAMKADLSTAMLKANNLSDLASISAARATLNVPQRVLYDVRDYGAVGDGTTDDTAHIQSALNAAPPGATVYLSGNHFVTAPIKVPPQVRLTGANGAHLDQAALATLYPSATFSGVAVILVEDQTSGGYSRVSNEQHITNLSIDFTHVPTSNVVDGIQILGFVSGGVLENIGINGPTAYGVNFVSNASGIASSWRAFRVSVIFANGTYGINATIYDSSWVDCEAKNCASNGWQVGNSVNSTFVTCRADNNTTNGFYFDSGDGSTGYVGGPIFVGCSTNRNGQNGVLIPSAANGHMPISFNGCRFQRDGSTSTSAGYAGVNVNGSTQPVMLNGCQVTPGTNSDGSGNNSPQYGLTSMNGNVFIQGGVWHGASFGIQDGGGNTNFVRGLGIIERTGTTAAPVDVFRGLQGSSGNTPSLDVPGNLAGVVPPSGHGGAIAWVYDPVECNMSGILSSGVIYLSAVFIAKKTTATKLYWDMQTAGASPLAGKNFVGLYNLAGTLITSVGVDARVTTTGLYSETISAAVVPGMYWVAWLFNATTGPSVARRTSTVDTALANFNLSAGASRFATYGSGLIALPASLTIASLVPSNLAYWAGIV